MSGSRRSPARRGIVEERPRIREKPPQAPKARAASVAESRVGPLRYAVGVGDSAHVLIVGGGVIGTGLAWALAERGIDGVVVVDLDLAGVYASSELNAGGARATWWQPVNIDSCRVTLDFFREHAQEFGFRQAGYLWLFELAPRS